jgi:hypothetical protein
METSVIFVVDYFSFELNNRRFNNESGLNDLATAQFSQRVIPDEVLEVDWEDELIETWLGGPEDKVKSVDRLRLDLDLVNAGLGYGAINDLLLHGCSSAE